MAKEPSIKELLLVERAVGALVAQGVRDGEEARTLLEHIASREAKSVPELAEEIYHRLIHGRSTPDAIASDFARLGDAVAMVPPDEVLARVTELSAQRIPTAAAASVTMRDERGKMTTVAATDDLAVQVDNIQYRLAEGPCMQAIEENEALAPSDLLSDERWPRFGQQAAELGVHSVLSFRLGGDYQLEDVFTSLNVYGRPPRAFNDHDILLGSMLAAHATTSLVANRFKDRADNLQRALGTNREIGMALGILMHRHKLTREAAFDLLRVASQRTNRKLRDIAADVVDTGELACPHRGKKRR